MKIILNNHRATKPVFVVPEFNFGQMQRWKGVERLRYSIIIDASVFIEKISSMFAKFREDEIQEDDPNDLEELINYKEAGRPTLVELFNKNLPLLKELIIYHEYDILHLLVENPKGKLQLFYSINSIDIVSINKNEILLEGICFEVDRK
ncbi:MAG: hypothetical protein JXR05_11645 [Flavobacteriaceae bacterium]